MKVIDPGHLYQLDHLDGSGHQLLRFCKRLIVPGRTEAWEGTTCQETLRALIDRVQVLDAELPWEGNNVILQRLRLALIGFEARALERHVEKGTLRPEEIATNPEDGHFAWKPKGFT